MKPISKVNQTTKPSVLISGGCDASGRVPVLDHLHAIKALVSGRRSNWHLGLASHKDIATLRPYLDIVSFDFVGDDATIREVYGIDATADDYERCFAALAQVAKVVPHVTLGLRGGRMGHEWAALDRLRTYDFDRLVILVLIPTPNTAYADAQPPEPSEVARFVATARLRFPSVALQLGCMRPMGGYRKTVDVLAIRAGINVIVNPAPEARSAATALGLKWLKCSECCVFSPVPSKDA